MIHVIINMFLFDLLLLKKCFGDTFFLGDWHSLYNDEVLATQCEHKRFVPKPCSCPPCVFLPAACWSLSSFTHCGRAIGFRPASGNQCLESSVFVARLLDSSQAGIQGISGNQMAGFQLSTDLAARLLDPKQTLSDHNHSSIRSLPNAITFFCQPPHVSTVDSAELRPLTAKFLIAKLYYREGLAIQHMMCDSLWTSVSKK